MGWFRGWTPRGRPIPAHKVRGFDGVRRLATPPSKPTCLHLGLPCSVGVASEPGALAGVRHGGASRRSHTVFPMPRSHTHLWPPLVSWENLLTAYHRCRRRKRYNAAAAAFDFDHESALLAIQRELCEGTYRPGAYRHFHITDPKPRKISAAPFRDRVVHHALVQILEPIFERSFVYDSYACRVGKGTHRAIRRARGYLRSHAYVLETDIVRFFPSVDHAVLMTAVARRIADARVLDLIRVILASGGEEHSEKAEVGFFPGDDLFAMARPRGLPIGNLTSQFFANVLLDRIDHFIKETLRVPGYVRYADDFVLFGNDKKDLWHWHDAMAHELAELRLRLHPHKTHVRPSAKGVTFLGWQISADGMRLSQQSVRRFSRRLRRLAWQRKRGEISVEEVRSSVRAWLAHAAHGNSLGIARRLLRKPL